MSQLPLVSPLDRVLFLKAQAYLRGLPADLLSVLALYTVEQFYPAGAVIRKGGSSVDRIQFLGEGQVEVVSDSSESGRTNEVEAPGVIGLGHYFAGGMNTPAVRARTDTLCLELDVGDLDQILEDHFSLLIQFLTRSAEEAQRGLQALGIHRPSEEGYDQKTVRDTPISLDLVQRLTLARRMPFLRGTNLKVLGELVRRELPVRIEQGRAVWREGEPVESIALVVDGCFRLIGSEAVVRAPAGSALGAWEILSSAPRVEGWQAETPSRVLFVSRDLFIDLLEDHHEFALSYLQLTALKTTETWKVRDELGPT